MAQDKMLIGGSRCALENWLETKAAAEPQLRSDLFSNPRGTLEKLSGRRMPDGIKILALPESPQVLYLVKRFEGAMEPYETGTSQGQLLSRSMHAMALNEDGFWSKVKNNPRGLLAERLALHLAPQVKVEILEEDANTAYFVLHHDDHYRAWTLPPEVMQKVRIKPPAQTATKPLAARLVINEGSVKR